MTSASQSELWRHDHTNDAALSATAAAVAADLFGKEAYVKYVHFIFSVFSLFLFKGSD